MLLDPTSKSKPEPEGRRRNAPGPGHLHEYVRSSSNKEIYICQHPDCTHYHRKEFILGKRAICYKCKKGFVLTREQLLNRIPVCLNCTRSQKGKSHKSVTEVLQDILDTPSDLTSADRVKVKEF